MTWGSLDGVRLGGSALGIAGALAASLLGIPAWLLADHGTDPSPIRPTATTPVIPAPALALGAVLRRPLFGSSSAPFDMSAGEVGGMPIGDPSTAGPELLGIVGRLPDDAVALVRSPDGRSRPVAIGGDAQGWRLAALAVDAALFVKDGARVRVALPATSD